MPSLRAVALAATLIAPTVALAEPGPMQGACKSDLRALCAGVQPGGGRIRDCMKQHHAQISAACKIAIADRMLERSGQRGARAQGSIEHMHQSVVGNGTGSSSIKPVPQQGN
jgi:hypothetical protein